MRPICEIQFRSLRFVCDTSRYRQRICRWPNLLFSNWIADATSIPRHLFSFAHNTCFLFSIFLAAENVIAANEKTNWKRARSSMQFRIAARVLICPINVCLSTPRRGRQPACSAKYSLFNALHLHTHRIWFCLNANGRHFIKNGARCMRARKKWEIEFKLNRILLNDLCSFRTRLNRSLILNIRFNSRPDHWRAPNCVLLVLRNIRQLSLGFSNE